MTTLAKISSQLVKEWHSTKNGKLTPNDVAPFSHKKVWWKCKNGHEWEATVAHRSGGQGCPFESNHRVYEGNCLANRKPELNKGCSFCKYILNNQEYEWE